jgi:hypothetical protein
MHLPFSTRARASALALALLTVTAAQAQQPPAKDVLMPADPSTVETGKPRSIEVIPPAPEEKGTKKAVPRAKRITVKGADGKNTFVYKCGDEFTDSPVCTAPIKPSTMQPTADEMARCKLLKSGNFVPWYCR